MEHRRDAIEEGEVQHSEYRKVQSRGTGSLHVNIPSEVQIFVDIEKGDEVRIDIHEDGFFVSPEPESE